MRSKFVFKVFLLFLLLYPGQLIAEQIAIGSFVFPILAPKLSSKYGKRYHPILKFSRHHRGVDLAVPPNSHVRAVAGGTVIYSDTHGGFGKLVTVYHRDGYSSLYAHLDELRVNPGQKIEAGQIIGRVGDTGRASGPHLHFEWRHHGNPIDPLEVFPNLAKEAQG